MTKLINKENITNYIPQRPPIVMIDEVISCDSEHVRTTFEILPDNLFVSDGYMSESGLLENIAQSAAAKIGYQCEQENKPVPLGFIGAITKVIVDELPKAESTIETFIDVQREVFGVTIVKGVCKLGERQLIACEMKIAVASDS